MFGQPAEAEAAASPTSSEITLSPIHSKRPRKKHENKKVPENEPANPMDEEIVNFSHPPFSSSQHNRLPTPTTKEMKKNWKQAAEKFLNMQPKPEIITGLRLQQCFANSQIFLTKNPISPATEFSSRECFDLLFNKYLLSCLVNLFQESQRNILNNNPNLSKDYRKHLSTPISTKTIFALISTNLFLRHKKSDEIHEVRDMFSYLDKQGIKLPLGKQHYTALLRISSLPLQRIRDTLLPLINKNSRKYFHGKIIAAFDEHCFAYNPHQESRGDSRCDHEEIPKITIKGKPKPTGIWVFKTTVRTPRSLIPYTLDFQPILQSGEYNPRQYLLQAAQNFPCIHFICDSRFGGIDFIQSLPPSIKITSSLKYWEKKWLWDLLTRSLDLYHWCGIKWGETSLSVERNIDSGSKPVFYLLATNAFNFFTKPINLRPDPLLSISKKELQQKTAAEVKKFKIQQGLTATKTKKKMIDSIIALQTPERIETSQEKALLDLLAEEKIDGSAEHHLFYHNNFKHVDASNQYFHSQHPTKHLNSWKSKLILSLFDELITNCWAIRSEFVRGCRIDYALEVATSLLEELKNKP